VRRLVRSKFEANDRNIKAMILTENEILITPEPRVGVQVNSAAGGQQSAVPYSGRLSVLNRQLDGRDGETSRLGLPPAGVSIRVRRQSIVLATSHAMQRPIDLEFLVLSRLRKNK